MKALPILALLALCAGCQETAPSPSCLNPQKANRRLVCPAILDPVCGCDGKTYANACEAERAGVSYYTRGECTPSAPASGGK